MPIIRHILENEITRTSESIPPASREECPRASAAFWPLVIGLAALSGATALGHQVLWTRRLIDLLGASAEAVSRVFGCFFLGLALGSVAAIWLAPRLRRPWRWLAAAEIGILMLAAPILLLPHWTAGIWPAIGTAGMEGVTGDAVKFLLSVLLVTPPSFLMGWFLPLLAAGSFGRERVLHGDGLSVYAWNTLGGVAGVAVTALVFLPLWGAWGSMIAVMGTNVASAAGCLLADRLAGPQEVFGGCQKAPVISANDAPLAREGRWLPRLALLLAFLSGAFVLALEVVVFQMVMLVAPLSFYAPAVILFCVILALAAAAGLARFLISAEMADRWLVGILSLCAILTAANPILFFVLSRFEIGIGNFGTFHEFLAWIAIFTLVSCGPAFLAAGLLFPFLTAWSGASGGDAAGKRWGVLLAVNGAGGLVGAEFAYRVLLPSVGVFGGAWWVAAGYGAAAAIAALALARPGGSTARFFAPLGVAGLVLFLLYRPVATLAPVNPHAGFTVLEVRDGRDGSIAVVERMDIGRGILVYNQYMLGTTSARFDQERQAHIPLLLHPNPRDVAFIGVATGITPGAALRHAAVERVTAIELSQTVADIARDWFYEYNHDLADDPRARIVVEDGRTYLAAAREKFDVVIGDLFLPWGPGEARLYSREHFHETRNSLKPGGLFAQWLALYQLSEEDLASIVNTFHEAFPISYWFVNTFRPDAPSLALVGFKDGELDWNEAARRAFDEARTGMLLDPSVRQAPALFYIGSEERSGVFSNAQIHTLDNMLIELRAGRVRVTNKPEDVYILGRRWLGLANGRRERLLRGHFLPDAVRQAVRAGELLTEREILLREGGGPLPELERRIAEVLPDEFQRDSAADWSRWPGLRPRFHSQLE